jgi:hypothetical protein
MYGKTLFILCNILFAMAMKSLVFAKRILSFEVSPFVTYFQTPLNMYSIQNPSVENSPHRKPNSPKGVDTEDSSPDPTPQMGYVDRIAELQCTLSLVRNLVAGALSKAKRAEDHAGLGLRSERHYAM